ncbi:hypothetical protein AK830_g5981 [Neonectria ditissima]|uniref:Uncharacterized protein n=1 Tax=Neonectria ditissima TaxID=78410 RepID=A0A0P7B274_9HYPO|nr:hypothetical protein AK830_g5981 [Neonectria ditissima]
MMLSQLYTRLDQSEEDVPTSPEHEHNEESRTKSCGHVRTCIYIFLGILATSLFALFGFVGYRTAASPSTTYNSSVPATRLHCGNSSTDAQALGCIFDLLTNTWMPKYCSDSSTDTEFREWVLDPQRQLGAWAYFYDEKAQHRVSSEEELSKLIGKHVFTTTENHLAHCTLLARRMHRLITGEITAVAHNTFAHTIHCTSAILESLGTGKMLDEPQIGSTFDVGLVSCLV